VSARKRPPVDDLGPLFGGLVDSYTARAASPRPRPRASVENRPIVAVEPASVFVPPAASDAPAEYSRARAGQSLNAGGFGSFVDLPAAGPAILPGAASDASTDTESEASSGAAVPAVLSVAGLAAVLRGALERSFPVAVWVEGEVSGAKFAPSGHLYFALKDETGDATMDVVMYRGSLKPHTRTIVKDGAKVRLRGKPVYWAPRGRLQFVADAVEPTGQGALLIALAQLKQRLTQEGLFAPERKRPLPSAPRIIGVVTSATGAVIHDIRKVAFRRGGAHILLAPAQVQGNGAAESIRNALAMLQTVSGVDVIIVGRGGGSADDLMCFNDEALVRAIAACPVPVVSAVGHEVDVTLTCHVADRRAATPSQAAEFVVQDRAAQAQMLAERGQRLVRAIRSRTARTRLMLSKQSSALRDPRLIMASAQQRLDEQQMRMGSALSRKIRILRDVHARRRMRLGLRDPRHILAESRARHAAAAQKLVACMQRTVATARSAHARHVAGLDALSPLRVLGRGYALATIVEQAVAARAVGVEPLLRDAGQVVAGTHVRVRVARGAIVAQVLTVTLDGEHNASVLAVENP
jgi:exodeoxyribonuclease VII large subunit